jgi:putative tricarboxylic transport membrane protein
MYDLVYAMAGAITPVMILTVVAGVLIGTVIGALPGIGSVVTIALMIPFLIGMDPSLAVVLCACIYSADAYGGAITSILINTPGSPSSAATTFDGYPLARQGRAGAALGMAAVSSAIGGIFAVFVLMFAAPALARLAYEFGPPEYFALAVFGVSMVSTIGGDSPLKNAIAGCLGVLISTVGIDFTTGAERFTFGVPELTEGVQFAALMIGLFAGSELLFQVLNPERDRRLLASAAIALPSREDMRRCLPTIGFSSVIGVLIGILPAAGSTVASLVGYNEARRWSKNRKQFGKGAIEGVAAPEAANNAAVGGAMVPTLALGIPGSGTTAMILGVMIMVGLRPGPMLFEQQPEFLGALFGAMLVANVVFLFIGVLLAKWFARISLVDDSYLWPAIGVFCVIGAYTFSNSTVDLVVMLIASVVGLLMRLRGFSLAPVVIGVVLGELLEESLKQSYIIFEGNLWLFFQRGICVFFLLLSVLAFLWPLVQRLVGWWRRPLAQEA